MKTLIAYAVGLTPILIMSLLSIYAVTLPKEEGNGCKEIITPSNTTSYLNENDCHKTWAGVYMQPDIFILVVASSIILSAIITIIGIQIANPKGKVSEFIKNIFKKMRERKRVAPHEESAGIEL
jgi:hypothetical protein